MKRMITTIGLIAVLVMGVVGFAATASAFPAKKKACSSCHGTSKTVKITLTRSASTTTTVTYKIKVTGGKGQAGWAVFKGAANVKRRTASTGSFTLTKGTAYKIWAVRASSGAKLKNFTPK
ncbi:MAG: hypothetical protein HGB10_01720 [Coriobacteriia bacterium]|nr:hypothetical protein [Coriobacteriia bacterium]